MNKYSDKLRRFCSEKNISLEDIALMLGCNSTDLLKIKNGQLKDIDTNSFTTLQSFLDLQVKDDQIDDSNFHKLPSEADIKIALKEIQSRIDAWPYPAMLADFAWRSIYLNTKFLQHLNVDSHAQDSLNKLRLNILETPFLPEKMLNINVEIGEDENSSKPAKVAFIEAYKFENHEYSNTLWFKELVSRLTQNKEFKKMWESIPTNQATRRLFRYFYKKITFEKNGKKVTLKFHIHPAKLALDSRFWASFYQPADKTTSNFFKKLAAN